MINVRLGARTAAVVAVLVGCGGSLQRAQLHPAPAWKLELESLRVEFVDNPSSLTVDERERLARLLDFGADDPGRADLVDDAIASSAAHRARALRAWHQRDGQRFTELATAALTGAPADPGAAALLTALAWNNGEVPQHDAFVAATLNEILRGSPHPDVAYQARLMLFHRANADGDTVRAAALASALGAPAVWRVLSRWGDVAARDFARLGASEVPPIPPLRSRSDNRDLSSAAASLPFGALDWTRVPTDGAVVLAATACRAATSWTGTLRVRTDAAFRVRIDGIEAIARDVFRDVADGEVRTGVSLAPGWHRVSVEIADDAPTTALRLHLTRPDGAPACAEWAEAVPTGGPVASPATFMSPAPSAVEALIAAAASNDRARREAWIVATDGPFASPRRASAIADAWRAAWPGHTEAWFAVAETAARDPECAVQRRRARARAGYRAALDRRPTHVPSLLALAGLLRQDGDTAGARALAERARSVTPDDPRPRLMLADVAVDVGLIGEARAALAGLDALGAVERRALLGSIDDEAVPMAGNAASTTARAAACRAVGDLRCAERLLRAALADGDGSVRGPLVSLLAATDRLEAARSITGGAPDYTVVLGDLEHAAGEIEKSRADWARAAQMPGPLGDRGRRALAWLDRVDLDGLFELEGRSVLADWRAWTPTPDIAVAIEATERVELLDQWVAILRLDGSVDHLTHRMTLARTPRAADAVGELRLPDGARLLSVRTLTASGKVIDSEGDHGKGETSFSRLAPGRIVDYRFASRDPPVFGPAGGAAFGFVYQLEEAPVFRSEFVLLVPDEIPVGAVSIQSYHGPPAPEQSSWAGHRVYRWRVSGVSPLLIESNAAPNREFAARTTVRFGVDLQLTADSALRALWRGIRASRGIADAAARLVVSGDSDATARRVFAFVRDEIGSDGSIALTTPAAHVLDARHGSRAVLLRALLDAAGVAAEVVLVAPRDRAQSADPQQEPGYFHRPVVRIELEDRAVVWLDPAPNGALYGELVPALCGADGLAIERWPAVVVELPDVVTGGDREPDWRFVLKLHVSTAGALVGSMTIRARGPASASLRAVLPTFGPVQLAGVLERLLARPLPGLEVMTVRHLQVAPVDAPLVLNLDVRLPTSRDGDRRVLRGFAAGLLSADLAGARHPSAYLGGSFRRTPLLVTAVDEQVTIEIDATEAWRITAGWDSFDRVNPTGRAWQEVRSEGEAGRHLLVDRGVRLDLRRVAPADYPEFAAWARAITDRVSRPIVFESASMATPDRREAESWSEPAARAASSR